MFADPVDYRRASRTSPHFGQRKAQLFFNGFVCITTIRMGSRVNDGEGAFNVQRRRQVATRSMH